MPKSDRRLDRQRTAVHRHPGLVRLTHWVNAVCFLVLLTSGLQIFNAHPALYLGRDSDFQRPVFAFQVHEDAQFRTQGRIRLLGAEFETGDFMAAPGREDGLTARAFPGWITLPGYQDLATGRRWHFFFAWLLVGSLSAYVVHGLASRRIRREVWPGRRDLRGLGASLAEHLRLRRRGHEPALRYNPLQKLSYALVLFLLLPLMIVTGLCMSPALNAGFPWAPELFGGRQSARTVHFVAASLLALFAFAHVVMVVAAGFRPLRSMITGRYVVGGAP